MLIRSIFHLKSLLEFLDVVGGASNYHSKLLLISALIDTNLILSLSSLHEMYINFQSIRLLAGKMLYNIRMLQYLISI